MTPIDRNYRSFADASGLHVTDLDLRPDHPDDYADVLKLSAITDSIFERVTVRARDASENACDINRLCRGVVIDDFRFEGGRQCSIVVKGGSDVMLRDGVIVPHPDAAYDIELGGWSDQSMARSRLVLQYVRRADGLPLRVVCGWWSRPQIVSNWNVEILWRRSVGYHAYNLGKYAGRALHLV